MKLSKKTNKNYKKKSQKGKGKPELNCAVVEYLNFIPINSKKDVNKFYQKIDKTWGIDGEFSNVIVMDQVKIDDIKQLEKISKEVKLVCKRKNGNGDCEDTAQLIIDNLRSYHNPKGKYMVEYHRLEYYEYDSDSEEYLNKEPIFVQNHGYNICYLIESEQKEWFRYNQDYNLYK
jgi:hypothetical protein